MTGGVKLPTRHRATGCKLNLHKTFRRRPGNLLNALSTLNLRSVSSGYVE